MCGYCATGRSGSDTAPASTIRNGRTEAKIGRAMKKSTTSGAYRGRGLSDREMAQVRLLRPRPVVDQAPRRQDVDLALGVLVPRVLDRRVRPDEPLELLLRARVVVVVRGLGRLHRAVAARDQLAQTAADVPHLALGVEDQRAAVREVGAGAVHAEQVREARHRDAEMG